MSSYISAAIEAANSLNNLQTQNNFYNSRFSLDPKEKELSNNREFCNNKFNWFKLKYIFIINILPIILLILMLSMQVSDLKVYGALLVWIFGGVGYTMYLNAKYAYIGLNINNSKDITPENCGF